MRNYFPSNILKSIKKVVGRGMHHLHEPLFIGNEINYLKKTIKKNFVSSSGEYVKTFEEALQKITKAKFAIAVVNGTEALHISLKVLGIKNGDEVLVPALTFVGTVNAIVHSGAEPHFIDSNIETLGIDFLKLNNYLNKIAVISNGLTINKFTKKVIRAIVPVHIFGHPCKIDEIKKIAKKFNLVVIEDAAEALGSFYMNKHLGTFGKIGILSFNGNKTISTGAGGALILNSKILEKKARILINLCKKNHKWKYDYFSLGFNYKMPNINAALGCSQIKKLKSIMLHQRNLYKYYKSKLDNLGLGKVFKEPEKCKSNYWLQTFILKKSDKLLKDKILNKTNLIGVPTRTAWKLLDEINFLKQYPKMNLSSSKNIFNKIINLPSSINF